MTDEIYDKSIWPCHTPGMHWALSDAVYDIGTAAIVEDDAVEYEIDLENFPYGDESIFRFNALRAIRVRLSAWPSNIRSKVRAATLCIGGKAMETVTRQGDEDIEFSMFQGNTILPFFVVDDDILTVRVEFSGGSDDLRNWIPRRGLAAEGILVRLKDKTRPFFVAGGADAILTWDGVQHHIFQTASVPDRKGLLESLRRSTPTVKFANESHEKDLFCEEEAPTPQSELIAANIQKFLDLDDNKSCFTDVYNVLPLPEVPKQVVRKSLFQQEEDF